MITCWPLIIGIFQPSLVTIYLNTRWNFAAIGGYSLPWPEDTTILRHRGAYSRPEVAIVACGLRQQGFISHKSQPTPGRVVTLECSMLPDLAVFLANKVKDLSILLQDPMGALPGLTIKLSIHKSLNDCLLSQSNIQSKKLLFRWKYGSIVFRNS